MPTLERKTNRKVTKMARMAVARPSITPDADPDELIRRAAQQLDMLQTLIGEAVEAGAATPALLREGAGIARAAATVARVLAERERTLKDRAGKLGDKERQDLVADLVCDFPRAVRVEIHRRLGETLAKRGA